MAIQARDARVFPGPALDVATVCRYFAAVGLGAEQQEAAQHEPSEQASQGQQPFGQTDASEQHEPGQQPFGHAGAGAAVMLAAPGL